MFQPVLISDTQQFYGGIIFSDNVETLIWNKVLKGKDCRCWGNDQNVANKSG
jgi:hypothetical protein